MDSIKRKVVTTVKLGPINRTKWCVDRLCSLCFSGWRPFGIYRDEMHAGFASVEKGLGVMQSIIGSVETGVQQLENKTQENDAELKRIAQQQKEIAAEGAKGAKFAASMKALMGDMPDFGVIEDSPQDDSEEGDQKPD